MNKFSKLIEIVGDAFSSFVPLFSIVMAILINICLWKSMPWYWCIGINIASLLFILELITDD